MVFTIGSAVAAPSVMLLILDLFPTMRGLASSLQGFFHFALAAVNAGSIAPLLAHSLKALALGMAGFTIREPVPMAHLPASRASARHVTSPMNKLTALIFLLHIARIRDSLRAAELPT